MVHREVSGVAPQSAEAYSGRAQFFRSQGKTAEAVADIRQAVKLKPADGGIPFLADIRGGEPEVLHDRLVRC